MPDFWNPTDFEVHDGDDGYAGMEITSDGSLEINACRGTYEDRHGYMCDRDVTVTISPERAPEILAGIQAWIEQLPVRPS